MTPSTPTPTPDWIALLEDETGWLDALAESAAAARSVSMRDSAEALMSCLERQAELCQRLEASRRRRRDGLRAAGRSPDELPDVVMETVGPDQAQKALDRWFEAARAAQHEIDLNREFYGIALAAVEEAVTVLTGATSKSYDPRGRQVAGTARPIVSTSM